MGVRLLLLVPFLLVQGLQGQERRPLVGRVLDAQGQPIAGAQVTCAGQAAAHLPDLCPVDVVSVTADDRGRFRADLVPQMGYSVWALGPARDDGSCACSDIVTAAAGGVLDLRASAAQSPWPLRITGLADLPVQGPFMLRASSRAGPAHLAQVPVAADGAVVVPALPAGPVDLVLADAQGDPVFAWSFGDGRAPDQQLTLPPLREIPVRVVDEAGNGVAGVTIRARVDQVWTWGTDRFGAWSRSLWRPVAVSGEGGTAVARIPSEKDPYVDGERMDLVLMAAADGSADSPSGWLYRRFEDGLRVGADEDAEPAPAAAAGGAQAGAGQKAAAEKAPAEPPREVRFIMRPDQPVQGRLVRGSQPLAGARVSLTWIDRVRHNAKGTAWTHLRRSAVVATDAEGKFAVPGVRPDAHDLAAAALVDDQVLLLPDLQRDGATEIDLALARDVALQVLDPRKGPARCAGGALLPLGDGGSRIYERAVRFFTDGAGRCSIRVMPGDWVVLATDGENWVHERVGVADRDQQLELTMEPLALLRGIVRDPDDNPVADARLAFASSRSRGSSDPYQRLLDTVSRRFNQVQVQAVRSDAQGQFELRFLDRDLVQQQLRVRAGKRQSEEFAMRPEPEPVEVRVEGDGG